MRIDRRGPTSRRRTLGGLAMGAVLGGLGALGLPDQLGVTAGTLARSAPVAGSTFVVSLLLLLSTTAAQRWMRSLVALAATDWTAYAVWETRRAGN